MYPMTITSETFIIMPTTLTMQEYVAATGTHLRTVKRWLAEGLLPGAVQDPHTGRWAIPADARRTPKEQELLPRRAERPAEVDRSEPVSTEINWSQYPTMLTLKQAEKLIGVPWKTIAAHKEYYGVVEQDRMRVPLSTVMQLRGLK